MLLNISESIYLNDIYLDDINILGSIEIKEAVIISCIELFIGLQTYYFVFHCISDFYKSDGNKYLL